MKKNTYNAEIESRNELSREEEIAIMCCHNICISTLHDDADGRLHKRTFMQRKVSGAVRDEYLHIEMDELIAEEIVCTPALMQRHSQMLYI